MYVYVKNSYYTSQKENKIERSTYREYKELNRMTPADTIAYGRSDHIQNTRAWMEQEVGRENFVNKVTISMAWCARDFLVMMLVLINACRYDKIHMCN